MKKIFFFFSFLFLLPLTLALYGGETKTYHFDKCDELRVNITGNLTIDEGEYTILNNCTKNQTNYYICDCNDNYDFNVTFKTNAINNYTFYFNYDYSKEVGQNSGGGGGSRKRIEVCTPEWNCTEWGSCNSDFNKIRNCTDINECNSKNISENRWCYYPKKVIIPSEPQEEIISNKTVELPLELPKEPIEQELKNKGIPIFWILIAFFVVIIIVIIGVIIYVKNNEDY